jgi:hypothetical protein
LPASASSSWVSGDYGFLLGGKLHIVDGVDTVIVGGDIHLVNATTRASILVGGSRIAFTPRGNLAIGGTCNGMPCVQSGGMYCTCIQYLTVYLSFVGYNSRFQQKAGVTHAVQVGGKDSMNSAADSYDVKFAGPRRRLNATGVHIMRHGPIRCSES